MRRVSVHIAHKLLYAWFILRQTESQIIGQRETVSVFSFYSNHSRKLYFALIGRFKWQWESVSLVQASGLFNPL